MKFRDLAESNDPAPKQDIVDKFADVDAKNRSWYISQWADKKGIDSDDAMHMAGYVRDGYIGAGAWNWRYVGMGESVQEMDDEVDTGPTWKDDLEDALDGYPEWAHEYIKDGVCPECGGNGYMDGDYENEDGEENDECNGMYNYDCDEGEIRDNTWADELKSKEPEAPKQPAPSKEQIMKLLPMLHKEYVQSGRYNAFELGGILKQMYPELNKREAGSYVADFLSTFKEDISEPTDPELKYGAPKLSDKEVEAAKKRVAATLTKRKEVEKDRQKSIKSGHNPKVKQLLHDEGTKIMQQWITDFHKEFPKVPKRRGPSDPSFSPADLVKSVMAGGIEKTAKYFNRHGINRNGIDNEKTRANYDRVIVPASQEILLKLLPQIDIDKIKAAYNDPTILDMEEGIKDTLKKGVANELNESSDEVMVAKMLAKALGDENRWTEMSAPELYAELESTNPDVADMIRNLAKMLYDVRLQERAYKDVGVADTVKDQRGKEFNFDKGSKKFKSQDGEEADVTTKLGKDLMRVRKNQMKKTTPSYKTKKNQGIMASIEEAYGDNHEITLEDNEDFNDVFGVLGYSLCEQDTFEAEYQGRKVKLNKPMQGDTKKFKVYVKDPKTGNVKKVNFGHGGSSVKGKAMKIRKSNPKARKSFRARHNCDNPGPKTKARYWSCRKW